MTVPRKLRLVLLMCLLVCTVGCDQTSKHIARTGLSQVDSVTLPGGFGELRLAENPGSFLSLGALLSETARLAIFTYGVGVGLVVLFAYLTGCVQIHLVRFIGLSLLVAGGMSNLLDRILRHGLVTDFVMIQVGPFRTGVFNLADVIIMIGISVMFWTFRRRTLSSGPTSRMQRTPR